MSRPTVTPLTERWYAAMPETYRIEDPATNWTTLRILSAVGDDWDPLQALIERLAPRTGTSALVDPAAADPDWLEWLSAVTGTRWNPALPIDRQRERIADPRRLRHGTPHAIAEAVVDAYPTALPVVARHWRDQPWHAVIGTTEEETPPTGMFIGTWDELEATYPSWDDTEAAIATWNDLATVDRIHLDVVEAARVEEPAGVQLFHLWKEDVAEALPEAEGAGVAGPLMAGGTGVAV